MFKLKVSLGTPRFDYGVKANALALTGQIGFLSLFSPPMSRSLLNLLLPF